MFFGFGLKTVRTKPRHFYLWLSCQRGELLVKFLYLGKIIVQLELFTYNLKDFSFIPDLKLFKV